MILPQKGGDVAVDCGQSLRLFFLKKEKEGVWKG
jgi:hypothetical protein